MKCAASELFTTSARWILLAISCASRLNTRSAPERSTRTLMPGNFASNALAIGSTTDKSMAL